MLDIQKFFVFYAVFQCLQHCLAKEQLWGVRFFTGDIQNAGTNMLVFLRLKGSDGYSEVKAVQNHGKYPADRQRNMVDYYYLSFKDVGPLQAIVLRMGLKEDRWFLTRVEMEKLDNHTRIRSIGIETTGMRSDRVRTFYVFNISYWFNRPLETKTFYRPAITTDRSYVLRVVTSDMEDSGTASTAYVRFYNDQQEKVQSDLFEIRHPDGSGRTVLNRGTTDKFQFTTRYIGTPTGVKMWFKRKTMYSDRLYRLDRIELEDIESDGKRRVYTFTRYGWMQVDKGQTYIIKRTKIYRATTYGLTVFTAQDKHAQTDARVWIQLVGKNRKESDYIQLDTPDSNDFEAASRDYFQFTIEDVGILHAVRLKIESGDSWRLLSMYIKWPLQTGWKEAYYVSCFCWVNSDHSKFRLARYLLSERPAT